VISAGERGDRLLASRRLIDAVASRSTRTGGDRPLACCRGSGKAALATHRRPSR
jgi:hypothetical protein